MQCPAKFVSLPRQMICAVCLCDTMFVHMDSFVRVKFWEDGLESGIPFFFFLVIWKLVGCMFKESIGSFEIVLPVVSLLFERQPLTELYTDQKA